MSSATIVRKIETLSFRILLPLCLSELLGHFAKLTSGDLASGHCEAATVMGITLALIRRYVKAGQSDFLCRLTTFCAGLVFGYFLGKAGAGGFAKKVDRKRSILWFRSV